MSDFVSEFWSGYVTLLTLASIAGCAVLLVVMSRARAKQEAPATAKTTTGHVWDGDLTEYNNPLPRWWLNLFWITLVFGVAYLLLFPGFGSMRGILGWTSSGAYAKERQDAEDRTRPLFEQYAKADVRALAADPDARAMGERLFLNYCAGCHGSAATGGRGFPNLTDKAWLYGGDPATIEKSILDGRMGVMPPMAPVIGAENVANVVAYVRSLSRLPHDSYRAQVGKPVFMQTCAACHGADVSRPGRMRCSAVAAAVLLSLLVGASRVMLGVHWPSDVIGGWSFGMLWVMLTLPSTQRLFGGDSATVGKRL